MGVPALGTTRVQHARTRKHTPRAHLAPRRDHPHCPSPCAGWAAAVPGVGGTAGMGGTRHPPRLTSCGPGGGGEDDDGELGGMVLTWRGRRPSGGVPAPPRDGPLLGWDAGVSAGEDPMAPAAGIWVWPRAPGEDSAGVVGVRETYPPPAAFRDCTPHGSPEFSLPSILPPSHPKKSIRAGGGCKLKWLNIRG